jgi:drug/metabolite transporter (DMT)-like permease
MEKEQKGERFTLIDPPRLPEKPFKPNRLAIVLIGLVLGIGAGVGLTALREFSDDAVRSADLLEAATGFAVLAGVPVIVTAEDGARNRRRRWAWAGAVVLSVALAVTCVHYLVMDLDVLWVRLVRRLAF